MWGKGGVESLNEDWADSWNLVRTWNFTKTPSTPSTGL